MGVADRIPIEATVRRTVFSSEPEPSEKKPTCGWLRMETAALESSQHLSKWLTPREAAKRYSKWFEIKRYPGTAPCWVDVTTRQLKEDFRLYYQSNTHWCVDETILMVEVDPLESEFRELSEKWYRETGMISMLHKKVIHPAYQRIIGMGKSALPYIFEELKNRRGHWLWALCAITGEDAAEPNHNFKQACEAWLKWGEKNGYA